VHQRHPAQCDVYGGVPLLYRWLSLGLVPTEHSSGTTRPQGSITKTGNSHARRLLIEAAWRHRQPPIDPGSSAVVSVTVIGVVSNSAQALTYYTKLRPGYHTHRCRPRGGKRLRTCRAAPSGGSAAITLLILVSTYAEQNLTEMPASPVVGA
jgi:Transposase IS116/IS110/IS902 family